MTVDPVTVDRPVLQHRSVSQLGSFTRCGEAYRLEKTTDAPRLPAAWFHQGTAFHEAAEFWEGTGRQASEAETVECYDTVWTREHEKGLANEPDINLWLTGGRTKAADDISRREVRGRDQIKAYMIWAAQSEWQPVSFSGEYCLEYPFELMLGGIKIIGSIDQIMQNRVTGRMVIRDLKTGTRLPDSPIQLGLYDLAIEDDWGYRIGWGDYYMAKNNDCTDAKDLTRYSRDYLTDLFVRMDRGVREGIFLPNPGDACRTCGVSRFCSEVGYDKTYSPYLPATDRIDIGG